MRRTLLNAERERWMSRASAAFAAVEAGNAQSATGYKYASDRAAALGRDLSPRVRRCGRTLFPIACACPSSRTWAAYTCRQCWLCRTCRTQRAKKIAGKVEVALEARVAQETARASNGAFGFGGWRSTIRIVLITLSVQHTGDLRADRRRIIAGWQNVRKQYHKAWGKFPFVATWEVTAGTVGDGHVHTHVAVVWPHRDWGRVRRWFLAGTHAGDPNPETPTARINFSCGFRFKNQPRNAKKHATTPRSTARYLAKYISKGADASTFTPELTAQVVAAFYGQRTMLSSHRFFLPRESRCPCCGFEVQRVYSIAAEWLHRAHDGTWSEPTGPPDDQLAALERGELSGFVQLS